MLTFDLFTKEGRRFLRGIPEFCTGLGLAWHAFHMLAEVGLWALILSFVLAAVGSNIGWWGVGADGVHIYTPDLPLLIQIGLGGGATTTLVCFLTVLMLQRFKIFK